MEIWRVEIILLSLLLEGVCSRDFSISLPEKIRALSGSCVEIKCRFEIKERFDKDLTGRATGVWHKDGTESDKIVFNSSFRQNFLIKGNMTGKLHQRDCTTVFYDVKANYSGLYYFRIEGEGGLKWTYAKTFVRIDVIESPLRPRVSAQQQELQDQQQVLEWSSVSLRCSAETLCSSPPPTLTWSSTPRIPLRESRPQELISDLNFTAAHTHHTLTFTCTVTYRIQESSRTANTSITLHVLYSPKISNSPSCAFGNVTVCVCEADGNPSPTVQWHLSGRPVSNSSILWISEERLNSTVLRSFITLHQSLTHTSALECVANNTHGTQRKLIQLTVIPQDRNKYIFSVLVGVAVGVFLMMLFIFCARRKNSKSSQTLKEDSHGNMTDTAFQQDGEIEFIYANHVVLSSPKISTPKSKESLTYASIDFRNIRLESEEIRGVSSTTADYAVLHYCAGVQERNAQGEVMSSTAVSQRW